MHIVHTRLHLSGHTLRADVRAPAPEPEPGIVWFEAGLGLDSSLWTPVLERLDAHHDLDGWTLLATDRAGLGSSTPGPREPRLSPTLTDADAQLAQVWGGPPAPLVLVGHSWGGSLQRLWSAAHPGSATGAVLVDASWERGPEHPAARGLGAIPRVAGRALLDAAEAVVHATLVTRLLGAHHAQLLELRRFVPSLDLLDHLNSAGKDWMPRNTTLVTTRRTGAPQVAVQERIAAARGWRLRTSTTRSHMIPLEDPHTVTRAVLEVIAQCTPMVAV